MVICLLHHKYARFHSLTYSVGIIDRVHCICKAAECGGGYMCALYMLMTKTLLYTRASILKILIWLLPLPSSYAASTTPIPFVLG